MTLVAGASQYLNASTLNNLRGGSQLSQPASLLGGFDNNVSLLEIGKQNAVPGIGLSSRARAITSQFLSQSRNATNIILSAGAQASIDGANTQIKALQAKLPKSAIGSFSGRYNLEGKADTNEFNTLGRKVDKSA